MIWAALMAVTDPAVMFNGLLAIVTSAMWVRIEHRLTRIETNCKRCDNSKPNNP